MNAMQCGWRTGVISGLRWIVALGAFLIAGAAAASELSERLYSRGLADFHGGDYVTAIVAFDRSVEADPGDPYARYYRGVTHARLGNHPAAVDDLTRAAESLPREPQVALELGSVLVEAGRYGEARHWLERAQGDEALVYRAALLEGLSHLREEDLDAARERFAQAAQPRSDVRVAGRYYSGLVAYRQSRWDAAVADFTFVRQAKPNSAMAQEAGVFLRRLEDVSSRPYRLHGEFGYQYDSNACLSPSGNCEFLARPDKSRGKEDSRGILSVGGTYDLLRRSAGEVRVGYEFFQSLHSDLSEFDLTNHRPTAQAAFRAGALRFGVHGRFDYFQRDTEDFLQATSALPWLIFDQGQRGRAEVYYRLRHRDFQERSFDVRDGINHAAGLRQLFYLGSESNHLAVGFRFDVERPSSSGAAAQAFAYEAAEANLGFRWTWPGQVVSGFGYAYRNEDYDQASALADGRARNDEEHRFRAVLEVPLLSWLAGRVGYFGAINESSHDDLFEYERHIASVTVRAEY